MRSAAPALPDILGIWESACGLPPVERDLALLGVCLPEADPSTLAALRIGRRDAQLIRLWDRLYGPRLDALLACGCGELLEVSIDLSVVGSTAPNGQDELEDSAPEWVSIVADGYQVAARLPNSTDLAAAAAVARQDPGLARAELADRLLSARRNGTAVPAHALPPAVIERAMQAVAASDPDAEISLDASCPACGRVQNAVLDIGAHLWARVDADARRGLRDVTALARAYRWSESAILSMSDHRRRVYLELLA